MFKLMFQWVSICVPAVSLLYFGPFNPFYYSPLPTFISHLPHFSTAFSIHPYILYLHRCHAFDIVDTLSFSLPFPPSLSSIESFHCCVLHTNLNFCWGISYINAVFLFQSSFSLVQMLAQRDGPYQVTV
jgi:hypothetical protein